MQDGSEDDEQGCICEVEAWTNPGRMFNVARSTGRRMTYLLPKPSINRMGSLTFGSSWPSAVRNRLGVKISESGYTALSQDIALFSAVSLCLSAEDLLERTKRSE